MLQNKLHVFVSRFTEPLEQRLLKRRTTVPLSDLASRTLRPTLGPKLALTRPNSPLAIMCKFPYLALSRLNSPKLAQTRLHSSPLPSGYQFQWA